MKIIINKPGSEHYSNDVVDEFENIILAESKARTVNPFGRKTANFFFYFWRFLNKIGIRRTPLELIMPYRGNRRPDKTFFTIFMGTEYRKSLPYFMLPARKSIYMFDAWPNIHDRLKEYVCHFRVRNVFVSSSQSCERLKDISCEVKIKWIPEGVDPGEYFFQPYSGKDIDVLAFGRQYAEYHRLILEPLESAGKNYLWAKNYSENETPIFDTKKSFAAGLSRAKISICVPSSITNPERSGDIETMTTRYLQSMVSKCLIVGHAPAEMLGLFGYNPVIEIDMNNPGAQLLEILDNYSSYIEMIEKNYSEVIKNHTWKNRWQTINEML